MKIFDCFKFYNEFEILDLRFLTLNDHVDYFVLVEATNTHTGKSKPLNFEENKLKYMDYLPKIIHIIVDDLPPYRVETLWNAENYQRNCISLGLDGLAQPGDKILVSDCDEIWNPDVVVPYFDQPGVHVFEQKLFYYYVNCKQNVLWNGTCLANYGEFQNPQQLRDYSRFVCKDPIKDGGWHYSYMSNTAEGIKEKIDNIAESSCVYEMMGGEFDPDIVQKRIDNLEDFMGRTDDNSRKELVDLKGNSPDCIYEWILKYPNLYKR